MGGDIIGYGSFRPPSHSHTTYCDVKAVSKIAFYPPAAWLDPLQDWKNLHLIGIGVAGLLDGWTILTITLRTSCLAGTDYWLQATSSWFQDHFPPLFPPPLPLLSIMARTWFEEEIAGLQPGTSCFHLTVLNFEQGHFELRKRKCLGQTLIQAESNLSINTNIKHTSKK